VRELRNVCDRLALFLLAEPLQSLTPKLLLRAMPELSLDPVLVSEPAPVHDSTLSKQQLNQVIQRFKGNRAAAAQQLGISRTTLWRKLKEPD
jgi:propionate catabolism operon transcriptional regulator